MARILVVDDTVDIRFLVRAVLEQAGHHVIEAAGGRRGLEVLAEDDPPIDLVVLDVQMPEMDGWSTLESIRADHRMALLPVILCTVKSQHEDTRRGWELGCDGFVNKPFSITELADEVGAVLGRTPAERADFRQSMLKDSGRAGSEDGE